MATASRSGWSKNRHTAKDNQNQQLKCETMLKQSEFSWMPQFSPAGVVLCTTCSTKCLWAQVLRASMACRYHAGRPLE
jgi:predicted metal-binding protein